MYKLVANKEILFNARSEVDTVIKLLYSKVDNDVVFEIETVTEIELHNESKLYDVTNIELAKDVKKRLKI